MLGPISKVPGDGLEDTNMWLGLGLWARSAYFRLFTGNHSVTVRSYLCSDRLIFIYSDNHILFEGSRNLSFDE